MSQLESFSLSWAFQSKKDFLTSSFSIFWASVNSKSSVKRELTVDINIKSRLNIHKHINNVSGEGKGES